MPTLRRVADTPTWLLGRVNAGAQARLAEAFAKAGVRGYHFRLLAGLEEHGPCSQADLGRATGLDRSDVVVTLDDLVEWGLASRERDPDHGRRNVVALTVAGEARLGELQVVLEDVQQAVLATLDAEERRTLLRLLGKLVASERD